MTSEFGTLAKTGGLADVALALPRQLHRDGHDVRVIMPFYSSIDTGTADFLRVEFIRDVELIFGWRRPRFDAWTTRLPGTDGWIYLLDCPDLHRRGSIYTEDPDEHVRFAMLARAAVECCQRMGWAPDVFHCNDWHAALLPLYLKSVYAWDAMFTSSRTLLTIHNVAYQGVFPAGVVGELGLAEHAHLVHQEDLKAGRFGFLTSGILHADALSTVSPTHAREIQHERYGLGLAGMLRARADHLVGILNGVDYEEWDPRSDGRIAFRYSPEDLEGKARNRRFLLERTGLSVDERVPLLGVVSRLTEQKGFDLCFEVLPALLSRGALSVVALGSGEPRYEEFFGRLHHRFPDRVFFYRGYHEELAHQIEAGADMFLMPSRYEPCGLNQMFSLRYGTVPVVRRTGGLADTVEAYDPATGSGTGFVFDHFTSDGLRWAVELALTVFADRETWQRLMRSGMSRDFSWRRQAAQYVRLYRALVGG